MPEELVSNLPLKDAEELCEERNGDFEVRRGEIYVVWNDDESEAERARRR